MRRHLTLLIILVLGLAAGAGVAACGSGDTSSSAAGETSGEKVLTIGYSAALSGPYAAYDGPVVHGAQLAEDQINKAGGINGWKVKLDLVDNKGDQALSATTTQELLDKGVRTFIVTCSDSMTAQTQLIAQGGGIVNLGALTAPTVAIDAGKRAFMTTFGDNTQSAAIADYCLAQGYKTAYLISSPELPATELSPKWFADVFTAGGGQIVGEDTYKIGQSEYGTQVTKIKNCEPQPDVIFSAIFVPDSGVFLKQLRGAGIDIPFVSLDGNDSELFPQSGGNAVDGAVYATHAFSGSPGMMQEFLAAYEDFFGKKPETNAIEAIGRDCVYLMVQAAAKAGSSDPDKVLAAIHETKGFPLLTGDYSAVEGSVVPDLPVFLIKMDGTKTTLVDEVRPTNVPDPLAQ